MIRSILTGLPVIVFCSFAFITSTGEEKGVYESAAFKGQKIQNTVFGEYLKENYSGRTMVMVVMYPCDHCMDATKDAQKLMDEKLVDNILIMGTEGLDAGSKEKFMKEVGQNYKTIDYNFDAFAEQLMAADSLFPNPPIGIFVQDNIIKKIYTQIPGVNSFEKYNPK